MSNSIDFAYYVVVDGKGLGIAPSHLEVHSPDGRIDIVTKIGAARTMCHCINKLGYSSGLAFHAASKVEFAI